MILPYASQHFMFFIHVRLLLERLWCKREWPTVPRDHTKFWIPTNQRRQMLDPPIRSVGKRLLELSTLLHYSLSDLSFARNTLGHLGGIR